MAERTLEAITAVPTHDCVTSVLIALNDLISVFSVFRGRWPTGSSRVGEIRKALQRVLSLSPTPGMGSADRASLETGKKTLPSADECQAAYTHKPVTLMDSKAAGLDGEGSQHALSPALRPARP